MKALVIAGNNLRRMFRRRANIFFVFVFPMMLILVLGATFGNAATPRLGVVVTRPGPLASALILQLQRTPQLQVRAVASDAALLTGVERGNYDAGLEIPAGYDAAVNSGRTAELSYVARPGVAGQQLGQEVRSVVDRQATLLGAARFAVAQHVAPNISAGLTQVRRIAPVVPAVSVRQESAGKTLFPQAVSQFDESSWTELLLFMFLTALTAGVALIEVRKLGVPRRMLATPTTAATLVAGEVLGRLLIGIVQALVIVFGSALLFGVHWGQPIAVIALVVLFGLVATGFGIFIGTLFRNEQQAQGISLLLGLGLAALGGCMVPLEVFSPTMRTVAHITPHAWANDAFAKLIGDGDSIGAILPQLGVLAIYAVVLLTLATWRLRRTLVSAPA
jgi:linearmycin/streptolysin S transport system permease protein